jgi:hypothetical protein
LEVFPKSTLKEVDHQRKEAQRRQIYDMWLACYTQEEIANMVKLSQMEISREIELINNLETFPKSLKLSAQYLDADWKPPLYTI